MFLLLTGDTNTLNSQELYTPQPSVLVAPLRRHLIVFFVYVDPSARQVRRWAPVAAQKNRSLPNPGGTHGKSIIPPAESTAPQLAILTMVRTLGNTFFVFVL